MEALSFLQSVAGYAQAQTQTSADRPIKLGTIDSSYVATSFPGTLPKVTFDGEVTLSGKTYPVLSPYAPKPSDRVVLVPIGTTYLIIGTLTANADLLVNLINAALQITVTRSAGTDHAFRSIVTGDATHRFIARADGRMLWGSGAASADTNLYRASADTLATDDSLKVTGNLTIGSDVVDTAWTSYTPTWSSTGTQPSIGNGTRTGAYKKIGATVFFRLKIVAGSTTTYGTGDYSFSLPLPVVDEQCASAIFRDNSAATEYPMVAWLQSTTSILHVVYGAGQRASSTVPVTWANADRFEITGVYETS